jgi:hypothetical protein
MPPPAFIWVFEQFKKGGFEKALLKYLYVSLEEKDKDEEVF